MCKPFMQNLIGYLYDIKCLGLHCITTFLIYGKSELWRALACNIKLNHFIDDTFIVETLNIALILFLGFGVELNNITFVKVGYIGHGPLS